MTIPATFVLMLGMSVSLASQAQRPAEAESRETVHEHWDRDNYAPGETAWFKAYLVSDRQFSPHSTVLYTDLLDPSLRLVRRVISPVFGGRASGQFEIPDTLRTGMYIVRAFTVGMTGQAGGSFFEKSLRIADEADRPIISGIIATGPTTPRLQVEFFPESGVLLAGHTNNVAFRASIGPGMPADIRGRIVDDSGRVMATTETVRKGRGRFVLVPGVGRTYSLRIDTMGMSYGFPIPTAVTQGVLLKIAPYADGYLFELADRSEEPLQRPATIVGEMRGRPVFRIDVPADKRDLRGRIRTDPETIRSGILTFKVLNSDGMPIAERKAFVRRSDILLASELRWDTVSFVPHALNRFTFSLSEPATGNLSISVSDASRDPAPAGLASIQSTVLLQAELPGSIEDPDWYFTAEEDSAVAGLDLLMMTNGWTRYDWKRSAATAPDRPKVKDPAYITIEGVVQDPVPSLKGTGGRIMMMMTGSTFGKRVEAVDVDPQGRFRIDSLLFFGDASLMFLDMSTKKSRPLKVLLTSRPLDSIPASLIAADWRTRQLPVHAISSTSTGDAVAGKGMNDTVKVLREVVVGARRKTPTQRLNEQYATGMFAEGETRMIDLVNGTDIAVQENIFEYLKFRVPGLQVAEPNTEVGAMPAMGDDPFNDPSGYRLYYRQQPTISSLGNIPMAIYLNEVQTSTSVIATIPANQIVMIKLFSTFAAAPGGGAGGALAIYTKDPNFAQPSRQPLPIRYTGFTITREFPVNDQMLEKSKEAEFRRTLLWKPDVFITPGSGPVSLRFFNADDVNSFRVRVQGMTSDGRFISLERLVTGK